MSMTKFCKNDSHVSPDSELQHTVGVTAQISELQPGARKLSSHFLRGVCRGLWKGERERERDGALEVESYLVDIHRRGAEAEVVRQLGWELATECPHCFIQGGWGPECTDFAEIAIVNFWRTSKNRSDFLGPQKCPSPLREPLVVPYWAIPRDYLSDTTLLRAMGFLVSQHGQLGAIPLTLF